ncbi:ExbD/TolR family protein [Massilia rhizosphaerae]|uniref:ExbD/TolR family protein n=1 Tax=Massilia rhizosphaerae TaxID=2784389 RepID=UPI0018DD703F|nr:biopolymer transporter ExbD [Massilia rhizosphaerae]
MRIDLGDDEQPEIGLIALIDCIFFLLMYFMVATSFRHPEAKKPEKELPIVLPTAQVSLDRATTAPAPLVIGVDAGGTAYIDGKEVSTQELHDLLKREAARDPARPIRIDGDQSTRYQDIVHVLELCQFEGFTKVAMHTR